MFLSLAPGRVPLADLEEASQACAIQSVETQMSLPEVRVYEMDERPLVTLYVNGKSVLCFRDTGFKSPLLREINPDNPLPQQSSVLEGPTRDFWESFYIHGRSLFRFHT